MKNTGVVRKLDGLGRITLPIELRRNFGWECGDPIEMYVSEEGICLKGRKDACSCGSKKDLINRNGQCICKKCILDLYKEVGDKIG